MDNYKHLNEDQIAICSEAMAKSNMDTLPEVWRTHLAECDDCANEVAMISIMLSEELESIKSQPTTKMINLKMIHWLGIAASVLIVVMAGLFIPGKVNKKVSGPITANVDSVPQEIIKPVKESKYENSSLKQRDQKVKKEKSKVISNHKKNAGNEVLLAYVPNEQLEKLSQRFSDAAFRGEEIEIKSPLTIQIHNKKELELSWINPGNENLIVEIYDNKAKKLEEIETTGSKCIPGQIEKPGLYYWKLINEDFDLLFCGKIIFK